MSQCISMHLAVFVKAQVATLMMAWFRHWVPDSDSAVPLGPKIYDVGVGTVWILRVLPMTVKAASWCHVNSDYKRCKLWCSVIFSGFCFHPFSLVVKSWVFQGDTICSLAQTSTNSASGDRDSSGLMMPAAGLRETKHAISVYLSNVWLPYCLPRLVSFKTWRYMMELHGIAGIIL